MKIKNVTDAAAAFFLCCIIIALTAFSADAREGAKNGIELCENVIIPSLLPILIICSVITKSRLALVFEKLFGGLIEKVLALPRESAPAVILGMVGGYPSGAVLTYSLYKNGVIDETDSERIMRFNVCSGAAFTVTAVGSVTYGSVKTGLVLYVISIISCFIIAFISKYPIKKTKAHVKLFMTYESLSDSLCNGVEDTVKALAVMGAFIVLFSALFGIVNPPEYLIPILEITSGICGDNTVPPSFACFFLSFGGFCVHFQIYTLLKKMKVRYPVFFFSRAAGAVISFALYKLYALIFPETDLVFSNISSPAHSFSSGGFALSMFMIIGCAVVIFDIENHKLKLHSLL